VFKIYNHSHKNSCNSFTNSHKFTRNCCLFGETGEALAGAASMGPHSARWPKNWHTFRTPYNFSNIDHFHTFSLSELGEHL